MDTADRIDDILACMGSSAVDPSRDVVDFLTYRSYRHNRELGVTAVDLAKLFPQTGAAMEQRYWDEINAYAAKMISLDKVARQAGGPQHDTDFVGRILRAGS